MLTVPPARKKILFDVLLFTALFGLIFAALGWEIKKQKTAAAAQAQLNRHLTQQQLSKFPTGIVNPLDSITPGVTGLLLEARVCVLDGYRSQACQVQRKNSSAPVYVVGPFRNNGLLTGKIMEECSQGAIPPCQAEQIEPQTQNYPYLGYYQPNKYGSARRTYIIYSLGNIFPPPNF